MFNFEQFKNGGPIIGNCHILNQFFFPQQSIKKTRTPISSTSILSRPSGPNDVRTMFAIAVAAKTILFQTKENLKQNNEEIATDHFEYELNHLETDTKEISVHFPQQSKDDYL